MDSGEVSGLMRACLNHLPIPDPSLPSPVLNRCDKRATSAPKGRTGGREFDPFLLGEYNTYVQTSGGAMPVKRLNIEIPWQQYERLQREASARGTTISRVIRDLIAGLEKRAGKRGTRSRRDDPLYVMGGSFDGPVSLAEKHDAYLYGKRR